MANGKKSVVMYCDLIHTVNKLTDEQAGKLFKHYLAYVNDLNPVCDDILIEIAFEPIKQSLKRDLDKWEDKKDGRSVNGRVGNLKRWHPDLYESVEKEEITLEEAENIAQSRKESPSDISESQKSQTVANVAVSVSDSVSDSVTVSDSVSDTNKIIIPEYEDFLSHALSKIPDLKEESVKLKYDSWIENGWKDGNDKPVKNWKAKLTNTVQYLERKPKSTSQMTKEEVEAFHRKGVL